jgi:hypothetical protein
LVSDIWQRNHGESLAANKDLALRELPHVDGQVASPLRFSLAMAVSGKNRHYLLKDIQRRHFNAIARKCGYGPSAEPLIGEVLARVPGAVADVASKLPAG